MRSEKKNNKGNKIAFLDQDFFYEDMESLTQVLRALATDGNKHRAKVDKRKQRSVFRDVLRAVEVGFLNAVIASRFELDCVRLLNLTIGPFC